MVAVDCDPMLTRAFLLCIAEQSVTIKILCLQGRSGEFGKLLRPDPVRAASAFDRTAVSRVHVKLALNERHKISAGIDNAKRNIKKRDGAGADARAQRLPPHQTWSRPSRLRTQREPLAPLPRLAFAPADAAALQTQRRPRARDALLRPLRSGRGSASRHHQRGRSLCHSVRLGSARANANS